jgi:nitrogen fixation protein FixH
MRTLIILVCIFIIVVTAVTIIVGSRSFDGIVVEKPYETGLAWDKAQEQKEKLGWNVSLQGGPYRVGKNDLGISISDRNERLIHDAEMSIRVTRPSTTAFDRTYQAAALPDGRFHASVDLVRPGMWDLIVHVQHADEQAEYTLHLYVQRPER